MKLMKNNKKESIKEIIKSVVETAVCVALILGLFTYIVVPVRIQGSSMENTLHDGNIAFINAIYPRMLSWLISLLSGSTHATKTLVKEKNETRFALSLSQVPLPAKMVRQHSAFVLASAKREMPKMQKTNRLR